MSSPDDTPVPTPSPAPRRRGRPRKNPVMEHSSIEDESSLFCIVRSGKSSLQVRMNHKMNFEQYTIILIQS